MDNILIFDMEGDNLLLDIRAAHCIVIYDPLDHSLSHYFDGGQVQSKLKKGDIVDGLQRLASADWIVGHNIAGFDIPVFKKLYGIDLFNLTNVFDTMLVSSILDSDIKGGHSLEAWAERLHLEQQKVAHEDWSKLTRELLYRCHTDVLINVEVFNHQEIFCGWENWEGILQLEVDVARIHSKQVQDGVTVDVEVALTNLAKMDQRLGEIDLRLLSLIPFRSLPGKEEPAPFKMDGKLKARVISYFDDENIKIAGPYSKVAFEQWDLSSSHQMKACLFTHYSWVPDTWNVKVHPDGRRERTSPKLTESSFDSLSDKEVGSLLKERSMLNHRRGVIENVKDPENKGVLSYVDSRGRVPANAFTCGTPTSRYRHAAPVVNIPRPSSPWGGELREIFCVGENEWQIGIDLSGIEARMMCHYCYDLPFGAELAELVLHGDFHQSNADAWDVERNTAKSGLYALMYGCGDGKLASTLGKPEKQGKKLKAAFWKANPALKSLVDLVEKVYKQKRFLSGFDRRKLKIRDARKLLNSLLQHGAAIIFKHWMVEVDKTITPHYDMQQMIAMHDELQFRFTGSYDEAVKVGQLVCEAATIVGKRLGAKVPIEAKAIVGRNWKECH